MPALVKGLADSPPAGEPAFIAAGHIHRPHGVTGEVFVEVYTDFPDRLLPKKMVYAGGSHAPLTIRNSRPHKDGLLLAFEGITTPEAAGRYRNQLIYVTTTGRPRLPEGQYYHDELLGFAVVVKDSNEPLGVLREIMQTGANDVYVVAKPAGGEILLPAIAEVVLDIDLPRKTIRVHLLPGLIEVEEG